MVIYVGNISRDTTEEQLREAMTEYGPVNSIQIMHDTVSGQSLGIAFIQMPDKKRAQKAVQALNMTRMNGRTVMLCQTPDRMERRAHSILWTRVVKGVYSS